MAERVRPGQLIRNLDAVRSLMAIQDTAARLNGGTGRMENGLLDSILREPVKPTVRVENGEDEEGFIVLDHGDFSEAGL